MWEVEGSKKDYVDKRAIEASDAFLVIISEHWVKDQLRQEELAYAVSLKKKIAVAVFDDVDPKPFLKDAKVIALRHFDRKLPLDSQLGQKLLKDFRDEIEEKLEINKQFG